MVLAAMKDWISEQLCVPMASACNLRCVYCQSPADGKHVPKARILAEVRRRGIKAVSLEGGGEPTVHKELFDWIRTLKAAGVDNFMLSTNAVALADMAYCRKVDRAVDYFTVNLPAADPDTYQKATRSAKFDMAVKGLENLKNLGAERKIRLFHIIFQGNYRALPSFSDWVIRNFPRAAFVNFTFVRNRGRVNDSAEIVPRYRNVEPYVKLALAKLRFQGMKALIQNMPLCRLKDFEGFSFELQRWSRGDHILEAGVAAKAGCPACGRCGLEPACCGARADYLRIHGAKELAASKKRLESIRPEAF